MSLFQRMPFITALISGASRWLTSAAVVIDRPVRLVGNSIGGVVALRAAQLLGERCRGVVLIDCAQRLMDDKQLATQPAWMTWIRPLLKTMVRQRWLSTALVPQCGTTRRDPQRAETGLPQWRQH